MWQTFDKQEILLKLNTDENVGLTDEQVKRIQQKEGKNILEDKKQESIIIKFFKQFNNCNSCFECNNGSITRGEGRKINRSIKKVGSTEM